ncbi:MAG: hypothetical protein HY868_16720 [Chloroflexi bacterium]|nr:hypothetical protein [Chloroflexota bacterium]
METVVPSASGDESKKVLILDAVDELAALIRGGCVVEFHPIPSMYGVLSVMVIVKPPANTAPRGLRDEPGAVARGERPSIPIRISMGLGLTDGRGNALAGLLRQARRFLGVR